MSHRDCEMPVLAKHPPRIVIREQLNRNVLPISFSIVSLFLFPFYSVKLAKAAKTPARDYLL